MPCRIGQALVFASGFLLFEAMSVVPATARAPSPAALVKTLLTRPILKSQLPGGYRLAETNRATPSALDRRHHVVGEVEIDFNHGNDSIFYLVFRTRGDALGDLKDSLPMVNGVTSRRSVPGLPPPALMLRGTQAGVAFAEVVFVRKNVLVAAIPGTTGGPTGALTLAALALTHLKAVD